MPARELENADEKAAPKAGIEIRVRMQSRGERRSRMKERIDQRKMIGRELGKTESHSDESSSKIIAKLLIYKYIIYKPLSLKAWKITTRKYFVFSDLRRVWVQTTSLYFAPGSFGLAASVLSSCFRWFGNAAGIGFSTGL